MPILTNTGPTTSCKTHTVVRAVIAFLLTLLVFFKMILNSLAYIKWQGITYNCNSFTITLLTVSSTCKTKPELLNKDNWLTFCDNECWQVNT